MELQGFETYDTFLKIRLSIYLPTYLFIHPSIHHPSIIHSSFISFHTGGIPGNISTLMSNMDNIGKGEIIFEFFNLVN